MTSHRRKAIAAATMATTALVALGAYARCTAPCPPPVNFPCAPASFDPTNPAASGYQIVFQDNFATDGTSHIDMSDTGNPGFHWYFKKPFGNADGASSSVTTDSNGIILSEATGSGITIDTAYPNGSSANGLGWVGTAFGNGAYFESTFAFDGPSIYSSGFAGGNPSWWSMSVEHWASVGGDQWPGQSSPYGHFIEDDFFEYENVNGNQAYWGSTEHDWYGQYNVTCSGFCNISNQGGTGSHGLNNFALTTSAGSPVFNATTFHTLGHLWVTGDSNNSLHGYVRTYMDGQPAITNGGGPTSSEVDWTHDTMPVPASFPNSSEVWSIQDNTSLVMILSGEGASPFHVKTVRVWQIPGCGTVVH